MKQSKITPYMRAQLEQLPPDELVTTINKIKFTPEQRKALLIQLNEVEKDPKATEQMKELVKEKPIEPVPHSQEERIEEVRQHFKLWI